MEQIDEKNNSQKISKYLGLDHEFININSNNDNLKQMLYIYGEPNENLTVLSINEICKKINKNFKVCLSGLGGDEIFSGYRKHEFFFKNRKIFDNKFLKTLKKFTYENFKFSLSDYFSENQILKILRFRNGRSTNYDKYISEIIDKYQDKYNNIYQYLIYYEFTYSLPKLIIPAMDRGGMREGVEIRTPYLNKKLAEYTLNLGYERLIKYGRKNLLVDILKTYIPDNYIQKKN